MATTRPAPLLGVGVKVRQGEKHYISLAERGLDGKVLTIAVHDFRGIVTEVITRAFDSYLVNAVGDREVIPGRFKGAASAVRKSCNYHGWVRWHDKIRAWCTVKEPTDPMGIERMRKRETAPSGDLFSEEQENDSSHGTDVLSPPFRVGD